MGRCHWGGGTFQLLPDAVVAAEEEFRKEQKLHSSALRRLNPAAYLCQVPRQVPRAGPALPDAHNYPPPNLITLRHKPHDCNAVGSEGCQILARDLR